MLNLSWSKCIVTFFKNNHKFYKCLVEICYIKLVKKIVMFYYMDKGIWQGTKTLVESTTSIYVTTSGNEVAYLSYVTHANRRVTNTVWKQLEQQIKTNNQIYTPAMKLGNNLFSQFFPSYSQTCKRAATLEARGCHIWLHACYNWSSTRANEVKQVGIGLYARLVARQRLAFNFSSDEML